MVTSSEDALSPLLFCVALNPLSNITERNGLGHTLKSEQRIHHLQLCMDVIKLYASSLINAVGIFSDDIGMGVGVGRRGLVVSVFDS
jgi:hypothetical protein